MHQVLWCLYRQHKEEYLSEFTLFRYILEEISKEVESGWAVKSELVDIPFCSLQVYFSDQIWGMRNNFWAVNNVLQLKIFSECTPFQQSQHLSGTRCILERADEPFRSSRATKVCLEYYLQCIFISLARVSKQLQMLIWMFHKYLIQKKNIYESSD